MTLSTGLIIPFAIFIMRFPSTHTSSRLSIEGVAHFAVRYTLMWMMMMEISVYAVVEKDCYGVVMIR